LELASMHLARMEEAEPLVERAFELAEASGSILARAEAAGAKGELARFREDYDEAAGWLSKSLDLFTEAGSRWGIGHTSKLLARAAVRAPQGRAEEAEALVREANDIIRGTEHARIRLDVLPPYAQCLRDRERAEEAAAVEADLPERATSAA